MQAGYKEREDRIAELEEFINDQVTELDKMEVAMKQTVANKEIAEKELNVCYMFVMYTQIRTQTHTSTHTHAHTYARTHTHTHIHTHTHTHSFIDTYFRKH